MTEIRQLSVNRLNKILESTIESIKSSQDEIIEIVNYSREEYKKLQSELKKLQSKITSAIMESERLEDLARKSRLNLSNKSKNYSTFNEDEVKKAYDLANEIRIQLLLKREDEKNLIERRKEIELRLKGAYEVYNKAERISKQISVASEYLMGNIDNIAITVDELSKKHYLGIKIIEAQEEERLRVARDMHDGPAQSLANVIVKAELCERLLEMDKDRAKNELQNLKEITRNTLKDVRKIIYDLRPMSLDDLGLVPTLERYFAIFEEDTEIVTNFKTYGNFNDIEPAIQIAIFRVIQESLSNIRKHSKAHSTSIVIEKSITQINLSVIDDGIGFDPEDDRDTFNPLSSGYGLMSIKERVELLNGKFQITSSSGSGTKLSISIPLNEEDYE